MKNLLAGITITALFLAVSPSQAYWETNSFTGGVGTWDISYNNTANGNNVDWVNSNLAGGSTGEMGGTYARHSSSAFYGRYLGSPMTLNDPMIWNGVFSFTNTYQTWNNSVYIGYFNTTAALADNVTTDYVAWRVREPNSGVTGPYRSRAQMSVGNVELARQSSPQSPAPYAQGASYAFHVQWIPSGLNNGAGVFSGSIGSYTFTQTVGPQANVGSFDAFGLFWDESAIDANVKFDGYFDNVEYLVGIPEPSAAMLLVLGSSALWLTRRVRSLRRK